MFEVKNGHIHIDMSMNLPIGNCGDGVSVNNKAARLMRELYGLNSPDFRCSAHAADGSLKRIARYETTCIEEVKSLYNNLRCVINHFSFSVKSKEQLDKAIEMFEMRKGVHLISWCSTTMAHFLTACVKANDLLVPLCNTILMLKACTP